MKLSYRTFTRYGLALQIAKIAFAAALSWWLASRLMFHAYPYFASIAAIITVQVTVADSLAKALQRIAGIILGVIVSLLIGHWLSVGTFSIFLVILLGLAIAHFMHLYNQIGSQTAISSLLVLAFGHTQGYAFGRVAETIVGCAVAVGINALVIPPNAIPSAEASLIRLSRKAADALRAFVPLSGQKDGGEHPDDAVESLIGEAEKSFQNMQLAKQSQKYSPFLSKMRSRLEVLSYSMNQLEKVTVQIRGIHRSLMELREMDEYRREGSDFERIYAAMKVTAECVEHYGEAAIQASAENKERQRNHIERARTAQLACLNEMTRTASPRIIREIGSILTDLNRILQEVSLDHPDAGTRRME